MRAIPFSNHLILPGTKMNPDHNIEQCPFSNHLILPGTKIKVMVG